MKTILLAIETATDACSAALLTSEQFLMRNEIAPKAHTQLILPMIKSLLEEADITRSQLTAIAVGRGPGSFTGVRIAMSVAQGLAFGWNLPLYPISTLAALAKQLENYLAVEEAIIIPALDARMGEIYWGAYRIEQGSLREVAPEKVSSPAQANEQILAWKKSNLLGIGAGWQQYADSLPMVSQYLGEYYPRAGEVALLARQQIIEGNKGMKAEEAMPVYLRDNVAKSC